MVKQKYCSECGYKFEKDYKFCPECGTKTGAKSSSGKNYTARKTKNQDSKNLNPKVIYGILLGAIGIIAIIVFTSGMLDTPTPPSVNNLQGQSDFSSGVNMNNIQAINDLEEKIKLNPEDYQSLLELAHLKNDSGLFEAAILNYKTYLEKRQDDADARVDMGVCYYNLKDYNNAIKEMETALKYAPNHQIAHLNLGVVNLSAGNLQASKDWLQKAYNINPTNEVGQKAEQLLKNH